MSNDELDNVFQGWLEKHDEEPLDPDRYISPRTGIKDCYQARYDDMKQAFEAGILYAKLHSVQR